VFDAVAFPRQEKNWGQPVQDNQQYAHPLGGIRWFSYDSLSGLFDEQSIMSFYMVIRHAGLKPSEFESQMRSQADA
jgi:hypothetical protein